MIRIENLNKQFGSLKALNQVNLDIQKGNCIALIGPNGCGKTTLIKSILGMVLPDSGKIFVNQVDIKNNIEYKQNIGYMPQIGRYPENMTVGQIIDMIKGIRKGYEVLDEDLYTQFEMHKLLDKKMRTLSGGTTQKVSAVLAFLFQPMILILDEPTAGLDPIAAEIFKNKVKKAIQQGCLVLITSHMISELEDIISQVIFMHEGNIIVHQNTNELKAAMGENTISKSILQMLKK